MTDQDLQQQRAHNWRTAGNAIRTLEDAQNFVESVGFCLMYPERALPLLPTFIGAYAGSAAGLPDVKQAFADARTQPATELMVRLLRERQAYEMNLFAGADLIVSASLFPFFYALVGDRNPKNPPRLRGQGAPVSPLAITVFEAIQEKGPVSKKQLRDLAGGEPSNAALDRALSELWSILKITRVDYREIDGAFWDVLYRWSPQVVKEGINISAPEAISALTGKYLEAVVAAPQEDVEQFFSHLTSRSKVREVLNALLGARELSLVPVGTRTFIHLTPAVEERRPNQRHDPTKVTSETKGRRMDRAASPGPGRRGIVIAIDGPAGSGKSTLAARLARTYGYTNIETGAMYRALALKAIETRVAFDDSAALAALARQSHIELEPREEGNRVLLDGRDVTDRIRREDVTEAASQVSVHPPVREWMVLRQQEMGSGGGIVMEGRDIGTKVFPDAEVKIFLDAAPETRGSRRFLQNPATTAPEASVLAEMRARDQRDRSRANSPLVPAPEAVTIDSTHLNLEQVVARAREIVDARLAAKSRQ